MLTGNELISALEYLPTYDSSIRNKSISERICSLSNLYKIYIPSNMSLEIYNKLYFAYIHAIEKKQTTMAIRQQNENHKAILNKNHFGIIGGSDSFTIIGVSGIGKSSAIERAAILISEDCISLSYPFIPFLIVQCPFDSSVKGLLLDILQKVDSYIGSNYYEQALRIRATTDMLINSVSQVALNHIGVLIVDEIQNVCRSKYGKNLVGMLTQLINNSGISICMVGTPECTAFFEQEMHLARRTQGLMYPSLPYNEFFQHFCTEVFSYQYVKKQTPITPGIIDWLYEYSKGITSVVISLIHDAQEMAILQGTEKLDNETLYIAYQNRLHTLHSHLQTERPTITSRNKEQIKTKVVQTINESIISDAVIASKKSRKSITDILKEQITIEEIAL